MFQSYQTLQAINAVVNSQVHINEFVLLEENKKVLKQIIFIY